MNQVVQAVFNESGVRQVLREQFPRIDKLESLDSLRDLKLTGINLREDVSYVGLWYEGVATDDLYPHVRARMIETGIANKNQITLREIGSKGTNEEYEKLHFSFDGVQMFLKVFNPNYSQ